MGLVGCLVMSECNSSGSELWRHGLHGESTAVLIDCNLLSLASCGGSYLWNPWNTLLSFWSWQWVNIPLLLYCYLGRLLKDQMGENNGVPCKNRRHTICEMSYFSLEDSSHFQQDILLRPPTGSHLVAGSLLREVWWWQIHCIKFWNEPGIAVESANKIGLCIHAAGIRLQRRLNLRVPIAKFLIPFHLDVLQQN